MIIIFMYIRNDTSSQFLFASPRLRSVPGDIVCGGGEGNATAPRFPPLHFQNHRIGGRAKSRPFCQKE
jgi:hypothetical protein